VSEIYSYKCNWVPNLNDKEIKRIYVKRRKTLKKGNCIRCGTNLTPVIFSCKWFPKRIGEVLTKGGITKEKKCPRCETDLMEFCFQDLLDEAKFKAKEIILKAKTASKSSHTASQKPNKKSSTKKGNMSASKKKCSNKNKKEGQGTLW